MNTPLENTVRNLESASDNLREALNNAGHVEGLFLLEMIKDVNILLRDVKAFYMARIRDQSDNQRKNETTTNFNDKING